MHKSLVHPNRPIVERPTPTSLPPVLSNSEPDGEEDVSEENDGHCNEDDGDEELMEGKKAKVLFAM